MANTLGVYNPQFYANEALLQLEKALGMAGRVHLGFDEERRSFGKGDVINIRKPSTFIVQDAPSTAQDVTTETVQLTLDKWKEVKFKLTDRELAFTGNRIITDHIRPAAYAIADFVDQTLAAHYTDVPWFADLGGTVSTSDITAVRKVMFDNAAPIQDIGRMHYMIDGALEQGFLDLTAFSQHQGAGDTGVSTQMRGTLGTKFGIETYANQNTPSHVKGTASVTALLTNGTPAVGATSMSLDAVSVTGTLVAGDTFVIAGNTQRYAVTATATASGNAFASVSFTPALVAAPGDGAAVTVSLDNHVANLMHHRNAFAIAMAPLSTLGSELGAKIAIAQDPITGLAIRSRMYYVGDSSEVHVALDILFGTKTLDPNLACRGRG